MSRGRTGREKIFFSDLSKESVIKIYLVSRELLRTIQHKDDADGGKAEWEISAVNSGVYLYVITSAEGTKKGKVSVIK